MERLIAEKLAYSKSHQSKLNPLLFDEDNNLKADVREKILALVEEFLEYIQVDIRVLDIRLVGSNAAYNYNEYSDLDIHIITDISEISDPEIIARLYFDSIKKQFKDSYNIKIKGIDVELYVEDVNTSSISNGIYSVKENGWIKEPTPLVSDSPSEDALDKAEEIEEEIIRSIKTVETAEELQEIVDKLYIMRKDSLSTEGENGAGNIAFKSLRNKGILDKVKQILRDVTSKKLSLESHIIEERLKDRVPSNEYLHANPNASKEPIRDAMRVNIRSMRDTIKGLEGYVDSTPQSKMTVSHISNNYLKKIDADLQGIRKYLGITKNT